MKHRSLRLWQSAATRPSWPDYPFVILIISLAKRMAGEVFISIKIKQSKKMIVVCTPYPYYRSHDFPAIFSGGLNIGLA